MSQLQSEQQEFDRTGYWACADCGISHQHHPNHDSHNITTAVSNSLTFNPRCHCGLHEAARLHQQGKLDAEPWVIEAIESERHKLYPVPKSTHDKIYR